MKKVMVALSILLLLLTACQQGHTVSAAKPGDVVAIWWHFNHPHFNPAYLILREDGTYTFAANPDGQHGESGEYWFENGHFMISDAYCPTPGSYDASIKVEGSKVVSITFQRNQDDCATRVRILTTTPGDWYSAVQ